MCGIAGFINPPDGREPRRILSAMADSIAHRGPDDTGLLATTTADGHFQVGLAHRRLSIIDVGGGHQPMGNETGQVQIVFNGEIYNFAELRQRLIALGHRFTTASDTETIVHAYEEWDTDCVSHFVGMFAFAIWDAGRERLFLARDRFGKKPLYLHQAGASLLFASEAKALLATPWVRRELDQDTLWAYLAYRYVPGPRTLYQGIRKLPPGHWALWESGRLTEQRYYTPPDQARATAPAQLGTDPVGDFLALLDHAVQIRMVSDVPFGAFLSGGIDSSAIVGLMARHTPHPVQTFSVGFADEGYSELGHARSIAQQFGTDHHELVVSEEHLIDHLPALVRFRDAPVAEPSDIPIYLLSQEARRSVKMVLTGEGSDEVLAGYPKHRFEAYAKPYHAIPAALRHGLVEPLINHLPYAFRRAKTLIAALSLENFEERMARWFGALSWAERDALLQLPPPRDPCRAWGLDSAEDNTPLRRILYFDQLNWLPDNLLERGDRMTMAAGIEARMPFLDHRLVEMVSALPADYRLRGRTTKWILRQAMTRLLPEAILKRPKVGFRVPVNVWFQHRLRDYVRDQLTGSRSLTRSYYKADALRKVLDEHASGRQNHEKLIWTLLSLEIWHQECLNAPTPAQP